MATAKQSDTVEIGCMDFRLTGNNFNYRNAGGSVTPYRDEIVKAFKDNPGKRNLRITVHRDCGGIKGVAAILDGKDLGVSPETGRAFTETFVRYFKGKGLEGATTHADADVRAGKMSLLEEFNQKLQERLARDILKEIGRSDVNVEVTLASVPSGQHADTVTVVVGNLDKTEAEVAKLAGSELGHTYIVRGATVEEVSPSLEIARLVMGKTDIVIVAATKEDVPAAQELARKPYMQEVTPRMVEGFRGKRITHA